MGFLDKLLGKKSSTVESPDEILSYFINDMEKRFLMHIKPNLPTVVKNATRMIYGVQILKFRGSLVEKEKAENVYNQNMSQGLYPLIENGNIQVSLTKILDVYIYLYDDNTMGFISYTVEGDTEKTLFSVKSNLENAIETYESFMRNSYKQTM